MAIYNNVVITDAGIALLRDIALTKRALNAGMMVTSESIISNPETTTTIPNVVQSQAFSLYSRGANRFTMEAQLVNTGVTSAYTLNTIGFHANDGVGADTLFAIITAQRAEVIPPESVYPISLHFRAIIEFDSSGSVTINATFAGYATSEDFNNHVDDTIFDNEEGVHGMRYTNDSLEIKIDDEWQSIVDNHSVFGVSIDLNNSNPQTSVTYTDDAAGMVGGASAWDSRPIFRNIRPCVMRDGAVQYYLNPNNFEQRADGTAANITGNDGDVMIEIPKTGYQIRTSGNRLTVKITNHPNLIGFNYYAHTRDYEGDKAHLYTGAYVGSFDASNRLRSISGVTPAANQTMNTFRGRAQANGAGYDLCSFYPLTLIQCLYLIRFGNLSSRTALGQGLVDSTGAQNTGATNASGMNFGVTGNPSNRLKCLGIEDLWGNISSWIDGVTIGSDWSILTAFKDFNDTGAGYQNNGQGATSDMGGFMVRPQGTSEAGFILREYGGSSSTFFTDFAMLVRGRLLSFGGTTGSHVGIFAHSFFPTPTTAESLIGGRLMYL